LAEAIESEFEDAHLVGACRVTAVMEDTLDHRGDLRRGTALQLRVDADRLSLDVPVDHDAAASVANVPFGHEVLIPSAKFLAVSRA
jgi:hypothetical protein